MMTEILVDKGKELWAFIKEYEAKHSPYDSDRPLLERTFKILNLIEVSSECDYSFSICHAFMAGYYTTLMMKGSTLGKPVYSFLSPIDEDALPDFSFNNQVPILLSHDYDATISDISTGIKTRGGMFLSPMIVWQIYLFCKMYRLFYSAEAYQGEVIFSSSDFNDSKFNVQYDEDREPIWEALREMALTDDEIKPKVYKIGNNYCIECLWWFPAKGLVRETIEYWNGGNRTKEAMNNHEVLIPYSYVESYFKHQEQSNK